MSSAGDPPTTVIGAASRAADKLIGVLPPAFLLLIGLNVGFIALVMWFINTQMEVRTEMANRILSSCIELDKFQLDELRQQRSH